jgi:hypothetical protein
MSTAIIPALPKPTKKRKNAKNAQPRDQPVLARREVHDAGGQCDIERGQHEHRAAADAVAQPAPEEGTRHCPKTGRNQDNRRLAVSEVPFLQDEGQDIPDQKEVKKIEHVAEIGGEDDPPLVGGQLLLSFETLEHRGGSRCWVEPGAAGRRRRGRRVAEEFARVAAAERPPKKPLAARPRSRRCSARIPPVGAPGDGPSASVRRRD